MGPINQLDIAIRHARTGGKVKKIEAGLSAMMALFQDETRCSLRGILLPTSSVNCAFKSIPIASNPDLHAMAVNLHMKDGTVINTEIIK
jgi:hypothetical protein